MRNLALRANIDVHEIQNKPMVVYEDHRSLVFVLWYAMHVEHLFDAPPVLVYFDAHDDGKQPSQTAYGKIQGLLANPNWNEREVYDLVEWDLSSTDDDWLIASFELGLISDAVMIGVRHDSNFQQFHATVTDHMGGTHNVWKISHLWDALGHQGELSDGARPQYKPLWDALNWNPHSQPVYQGSPCIVLDMDLDCFTGEIDQALVPWPELLLRERFNRYPQGGCANMNAVGFLRWLESQVAWWHFERSHAKVLTAAEVTTRSAFLVASIECSGAVPCFPTDL